MTNIKSFKKVELDLDDMSKHESPSNGSSYINVNLHDTPVIDGREATHVFDGPISSFFLTIVTTFSNRTHKSPCHKDSSEIREIHFLGNNKRGESKGKRGATVSDGMRMTRDEAVALEQIPSHAAAAKTFFFGVLYDSDKLFVVPGGSGMDLDRLLILCAVHACAAINPLRGARAKSRTQKSRIKTLPKCIRSILTIPPLFQRVVSRRVKSCTSLVGWLIQSMVLLLFNVSPYDTSPHTRIRENCYALLFLSRS